MVYIDIPEYYRILLMLPTPKQDLSLLNANSLH